MFLRRAPVAFLFAFVLPLSTPSPSRSQPVVDPYSASQSGDGSIILGGTPINNNTGSTAGGGTVDGGSSLTPPPGSNGRAPIGTEPLAPKFRGTPDTTFFNGGGPTDPGPGTDPQPPLPPQRASQDGGLLSAPAATHAVARDGLRPNSDAALPTTAASAQAADAGSSQASGTASSQASGAGATGSLALDARRLSAPLAQSSSLAADWLNQARRLTSLSDYEGALKDLDQAVRLDPLNALAWTRRAGTLNKLTRYPEASSDAGRALKLDPKDAQAWRELAWARLRDGDPRGAVEAATQALLLNPNDAVAYAVRARARWALGDKAGALADAEAAARLDARFKALADSMRAGTFVDNGDSAWADDAARLSMAPFRSPGARWPLWALLAALAAGAGAALWRARAHGKRARTFSALAKRDGNVVGGKYELRRLIGRGGMGEVHEAFDRSLRRAVAIKKVSTQSEEDPERLRRLIVSEATTVAALHHPNIVDIYEILDSGSDVYLVFELVSGQTLSQILKKNGGLEFAETLAIMDPICRALQFAHDRRLIHRDLKPANIMITEDGFVKLMDFGIARSLEATGLDARTRTVMGTPLYMAPEMESGQVSTAGDIYALGVTLYEMLMGAPPFQSVVQKVTLDFPTPSSRKPGVPAEVDALISAALQPDPGKRLRSADEFLSALTAAARGDRTPPARVAA